MECLVLHESQEDKNVERNSRADFKREWKNAVHLLSYFVYVYVIKFYFVALAGL